MKYIKLLLFSMITYGLIQSASANEIDLVGIKDPFKPFKTISTKIITEEAEDLSAPNLSAAMSSSTLNSIHYIASKDLRRAMINGETVVQGDKIGSATVVKIGTDHVLLEQNGKTETLTLYSGFNKRPSD